MSDVFDFDRMINVREQMRNNIESRKAAEGVFKGLLETMDLQDFHPSPRFWEVLHNLIGQYTPQPVEVKGTGEVAVSRMSDKQAKKFEKDRMPFGEYQGKQVKEVPLERLEWYAQQDFIDRVRSYLLSKRVREEMDNG